MCTGALMDIHDWPIEKVLQLPAACFGRRFIVSVSATLGIGASAFLESSFALPDKAVLWEVFAHSMKASASTSDVLGVFALALGEKKPTNRDEFVLLEQVFPSLGNVFGNARVMWTPVHLTSLRLPVLAQGRRLNFFLQNAGLPILSFVVHLVFTSLPTEIPDCYMEFPETDRNEILRLLRIGVKFR